MPDTLAGCRTVGGDWVYVVTDIESDGEVPGRNSMLTFASVAMSMNGQALGEFEAVLEPLPDASPNGETMAWWRTQPEAYSAATTNPESPVVVMRPFSSLWLLSPTGTRKGGAPDWTRTSGLPLRRRPLYPPELPGPNANTTEPGVRNLCSIPWATEPCRDDDLTRGHIYIAMP